VKLRLAVQYAARAGAPAPGEFRRWARAALAGVRRAQVALGVRVVGAAESRRLNRRYRGRDKPTNVLAFGFEPPPGVRSEVLGDVVVCASVVRREARAQGKDERAHWAHMVVHGILHLRGYDHGNEREASVMEGRERRILRRLGLPDPYL
jgi:probable rRNA maturation factor